MLKVSATENRTRKSTSKNAPKRYGVDLSTGGHSFLMLTQPYLATETAVHSPRSTRMLLIFDSYCSILAYGRRCRSELFSSQRPRLSSWEKPLGK